LVSSVKTKRRRLKINTVQLAPPYLEVDAADGREPDLKVPHAHQLHWLERGEQLAIRFGIILVVVAQVEFESKTKKQFIMC
jgi:hypothetical protein